MYQIGLISRPGRDLFCVRAEISRYTYFSIQTFTSAPSAVSVLKTRKLNALVVLLDQFTEKQILLLHKIRHFHPDLPMVFLTPTPLPDIQERMLREPRTILLSTHGDLSDLGGILVRLVNGRRVYNRNFARKKALQSVALHKSDNEFLGHGCFVDLASGGARLRAFDREYKKGDTFQVKVPLPFVKKTYTVNAEVVWAQKDAITGPAVGGALGAEMTRSQMVGLRFMSVNG